jgi:CheY-like chemotaxis protein
MGGMQKQTMEILLVEDNPGDVRLVREVFREGRVPCTFQVAVDGEEALAFLRQEGAHAGAVPPDIVILDLNLPRKDGREVLAEIKADPRLRRLPVIVLTSSAADQDVMKAYDLHANCYIVKPVDLDDYSEVVRVIEDFWLATVELPRKDRYEG